METVNLCKRRSSGGESLFVVVSAYPRPLVRTEPGQGILQKPVTRDLLCDRVEAACRLAA